MRPRPCPTCPPFLRPTPRCSFHLLFGIVVFSFLKILLLFPDPSPTRSHSAASFFLQAIFILSGTDIPLDPSLRALLEHHEPVENRGVGSRVSRRVPWPCRRTPAAGR